MAILDWKWVAWACAGGLLVALAGCSGDDDDDTGASGGVATGGTPSSGTGGANASTGGETSNSTGGAANDTGPNCGDLRCESGQVCFEKSAEFGGEDSTECATPPDGCAAWAICDCWTNEWVGAPVTGCVAFVPPTLYVSDVSCGDAPCEEGSVCLIDENGATAPTCTALPAGCTVDDSFCSGDCPTQLAEANGLSYAGCRRVGSYAGVTVRPAS